MSEDLQDYLRATLILYKVKRWLADLNYSQFMNKNAFQ